VKLTKENLAVAVQGQLVALFRLIEDVTGKNPDERIKLRVFEVASSLPYNRQYKIYRQAQKLVSAIVVMTRSGVSLMPVMDIIQMLLVSDEETLTRLINENQEPVRVRQAKEG
jgi:hypothetical protein